MAMNKSWHLWNKLGIMMTLFLQLYTMNAVCGNWVFKNLAHSETIGVREVRWMKFNAWLNLEFLVLISYIISAIIFLFVRCFLKDRWDLNLGTEITTENTDALEQKYLTLEVFQAFCGPMITTYFFYVHFRNQIGNHVCYVVMSFFWMQFAQTFFCLFIDFVNVYEIRTRGTTAYDNRCLRWFA